MTPLPAMVPDLRPEGRANPWARVRY